MEKVVMSRRLSPARPQASLMTEHERSKTRARIELVLADIRRLEARGLGWVGAPAAIAHTVPPTGYRPTSLATGLASGRRTPSSITLASFSGALATRRPAPSADDVALKPATAPRRHAS
jgi:hypothetical protein